MKLLPFIFFLVLLTSSVLGSTTDASFYYRANTPASVVLPCFDVDNNYCDSTYNCSLTITNPLFNVIIDNQQMTRNNSFYNYTISSDDLSVTGKYMAHAVCTNVTYSAFSIFYFEVTESGFFTNDWTFILAVGLIVFLFMIAAMFINSQEHPALQIFLFLFAFLNAMLIPAFFLVRNSKVMFYRIFMVFVWVFAIYMIVYGSYWALCK